MARMADTAKDDSRQQLLRAWLSERAAPLQACAPASADASFRRYFRVQFVADCTIGDMRLTTDHSYIAMDAPPAHEDTATFVRIARAWHAAGLPVPCVYDSDPEQGFALLQDLGDRALLAELQQTPALADARYAQAGRLLHQLHASIAPQALALPAYDDAFLRREMDLFPEWLCCRYLGLQWGDAEAAAWRDVCNVLVRNAVQQPQVTVHRDYHSRNLMVGSGGHIAMIDFQDAMHGPLCYDLASLLRDCYVEWPLDSVRDWARAWFDDCDLVADVAAAQRLRWLLLSGAQRHLKAAGIFARLALRDGKQGYLNDIPRTLGYIVMLRDTYPELEWLAGFIEDRCLPALAT